MISSKAGWQCKRPSTNMDQDVEIPLKETFKALGTLVIHWVVKINPSWRITGVPLIKQAQSPYKKGIRQVNQGM